MTRAANTYESPVTAAVAVNNTPLDRVRWPAVLAGLATALSTMTLLSVLGLAIGLSTFDGEDSARNYGFRAGMWGAVSAILAFAIGGFIAARTAAARGRNNGMLNGAMVWAAAVPLTMYLVGSGLGATASTAANSASDASAQVANTTTDTRTTTTTGDAASQVEDAARRTADQARGAVDRMTPSREQAVNAADTSGKAAWGVFGSLVLALLASGVGGLIGARRDGHDHDHGHGHGTHMTPTTT